MPYVALADATADSRLSWATARWDEVLRTAPHLAPAVALQRELIAVVVRLTERIEQGPLPRLSLPPGYLAAKLTRGIPVLAAEPIPLPVSALKPTLLDLCDGLARGGAGEAATHIRAALDEERMDAGSLLTASIGREQAAIRTGAVHRGLAPDLVWLVAELAASPFVYALQRRLLASATPDARVSTALDAWSHGYCPSCGSWPALAEVVTGRRLLRCSFCALAWGLPSRACIYCGEAGDPFVTAAPDERRQDRRLELCNRCRGYLKAVDVPELSPFPLLAITDLATMDLDMGAMERGYNRPALKDFSSGPSHHE
jgi:FdhE protein